eukprot:TRINITY_DN36669_c0_g1_i1.p2 TRINITY_DN36669_c0_g1~~TRINITY_DN36669_c0_g1_i1.p2  ORF type:complete len:457 (+),score=159.41 TRINITY_DN36669_c0_g1_i1:49-1371(+)
MRTAAVTRTTGGSRRTERAERADVAVRAAKDTASSSAAARVRSLLLRRSADKEVRQQLRSVDGELRRRLTHTCQLRDRLQKRLSGIGAELDAMREASAVVATALFDLRRPLSLAERRGEHRQRRITARELPSDDGSVQRQLSSEVADCRRAAVSLRDLLRDCNASAAEMERIQRLLRQDLADKRKALEVDQECLTSINEPRGDNAPPPTSPTTGVAMPPMWTAVKPSHLAYEQWRSSTLELLGAAGECENASQRLRRAADTLTKRMRQSSTTSAQATACVLRQQLRVDAALRSRVQRQLQQLVGETDALLEDRGRIAAALKEKVEALDVAQRRLRLRKRRPAREAVRDTVEECLESDVLSLEGIRRALERRLRLLDAELSRLTSAKRALEADLADKDEALKLDRDVLRLGQTDGSGSPHAERMLAAAGLWRPVSAPPRRR